MTKEEHIKEDRKNLYNKLRDVDMETNYSQEEIVEILDKHELNNGLVMLKPNKDMSGHEIIEAMVKIYTIIGDSIDRNIGLYD